jgi:hypothetical protein
MINHSCLHTVAAQMADAGLDPGNIGKRFELPIDDIGAIGKPQPRRRSIDTPS